MKKLAKQIIEELSICEMSTRLTKIETGLDYVIWCPADADIKKKAQPYIKASTESSSDFSFNDSISITINLKPSFLQTKKGYKKGDLISGKNFNKIKKFIIKNHTLLIKHWNGEISDAELLNQIIKL